jgi:predicted nucleotidyltransferase
MSASSLPQRLHRAIDTVSPRDRIRRVSLFGRHARGEAHAGSDIDLLIEFSPPVAYFDLLRVQQELEQRLGTCVDLVTRNSLSPYVRFDVLRDG